ncbi:MAG TPA: AAA family ATPase [Nitrospinota bacterium]|nr:AAA family ATPase [Nitrospinota bacterium]
MPAYDINLRDYWRVIRKKKLIIISTTLLMGIFSFFFAQYLKPMPLYKSTSSVKVERATTLAGLVLQVVSYAEGDNLATQAEVITSYPVIEKVAKEMGFIDKNIPSELIRRDKNLLRKVSALKDQISTKIEGYTNIINITAITPDPKLSQNLANTVAEVYRQENIQEKNKRIIKARKFIEEQLDIIGKRLRKNEENLREFKEKNKLIYFDTQTKGTLAELFSIESEYEKISNMLNEIIEIKKLLKSQKGFLEESLPPLIYVKLTPLFTSLHSLLSDLSIKLDKLLQIYTEDHPEVIEINNEIKMVIKKMTEELLSQETTLRTQQKRLQNHIENRRKNLDSLPETSLTLARLERNVSLDTQLYTLLQSKYQESLIQEAEKIEEITIIKPALEISSSINPPKVFLSTFIGIFIGIILGVVFAFISETLDTSIGTIEDVESYLNIPVLGIIPHIGIDEIKDIIAKKSHIEKDEKTLERNARLVSHFAPKSPVAESYRALRTNIQFIGLEKGVKSILFTSASLLEGKTTTVINLALTTAQMGHKTLLVDADLRRPTINKIFGIDREPGLTDIILGNSTLKEAVKTVTDIMVGKMGMEDIMLTPGIDNMNIISSGTPPPNPSELLTSERMNEFISQVEKEYDVVLFDSAPVLPATDAAILGSKINGVVIIYQVGKIARGALRRARVQLENVKANVIGVVLNGLKAEISPDFYDLKYEKYYVYEETPVAKAKKFSFLRSFLRMFFKKGEKKESKIDPKKEKIIIDKKTSGTSKKILVTFLSLLFLFNGLIWQKNIIKLEPLLINFEKNIQQKLKILKGQYQKIFKSQ